MGDAKLLHVAPISSRDAKRMVLALHYSGTVVTKSKLHLGVFLGGRCCGVMSFGQAMFQSQMLGLVRGSELDSFLELNRMAFSDALPRNSESRAIAIACRLLRQRAPQLKWLISFADATQCGDGTIYRAAGFLLTAIKRNTSLRRDPVSGRVMQSVGAHKRGLDKVFRSWEPVPGYSLRYVRFLDPAWRDRLTVEPIPYERLRKLGVSMYRGRRLDERPESEDDSVAPGARSERNPNQG